MVPNTSGTSVKYEISQVYNPRKLEGLHRKEHLPWATINGQFHHESSDAQSWWRRTGFPLGVLLQSAGYSTRSQLRHLLFYRIHIAPNLGAAPDVSEESSHWRSFMTDSSTPIEMSWDWGCDGQKPAIRYSVEPIGRDAGTAADPLNEFAASRLIDQFRRIFSETDLMWYDHFSKELAVFDSTSDRGNGNETTEAHQSRIFVAFDLREDDVMLKAYFFPTFKATQTGQSNLTVTIDAIVNLPHCPSFPAFAVLEDYIRTLDSGSHLGVEILGIDCEAPAKSRLKIYARSPATNFKSVRATMTLGARNDEPGLDQGFQELRQIWKLVLGKGKEFCDVDNLECIDHRTAGMLYYFEFKSGQALPTS